MPPVVTAFIGVIGSGKDHRATALAQAGAARLDFKDALLELTSDVCGYDVRADYDWFKAHPVGMRRPANRFQEAFADMDTRAMLAEYPELMTGRRLLQRLGTEGMRKRDPNHWTRQFAHGAACLLGKGLDIAVADCRFGNELATIRALPCRSRFVFCDYRSSRYDPKSTHESERMAQHAASMGLAPDAVLTEDQLDALMVGL